MILSDQTILQMLKERSLVIEPIEERQIQPASVDIRLGNTFSVVEDSAAGIITLDREIRYKTIQTDKYLLLPGQFVLATTMEYISLPNDLTDFVDSALDCIDLHHDLFAGYILIDHAVNC